MSIPLKKTDPAYWMLERGRWDTGWVSESTVYNPRCYICKDPEFALMGLPLCKPCEWIIDGVVCGAHTPADDVTCDNGHDAYEWYNRNNAQTDDEPNEGCNNSVS